MICYGHVKEHLPPPWIRGARELVSRAKAMGGFEYGLGPSYLLGNQKNEVELSNGWTVWVNGAIDPYYIRRDVRWCASFPVESLDGSVWAVPIILDKDGRRAFKVQYGKDFKPSLTSEQTEALEVANEARTLLGLILSEGREPSEDEMSVMCSMASKLLPITHHITSEVIATIGALDDSVVVGTLVGATSFNMEG